LQLQLTAGFNRPFQAEWAPREADNPVIGHIIKWSHYVSKWGGRELNKLAERHQFSAEKLGYIHSMRHTFKQIPGTASMSGEISEAICGRRHASPHSGAQARKTAGQIAGASFAGKYYDFAVRASLGETKDVCLTKFVLC
jgi:hypothetical protein